MCSLPCDDDLIILSQSDAAEFLCSWLLLIDCDSLLERFASGAIDVEHYVTTLAGCYCSRDGKAIARQANHLSFVVQDWVGCDLGFFDYFPTICSKHSEQVAIAFYWSVNIVCVGDDKVAIFKVINTWCLLEAISCAIVSEFLTTPRSIGIKYLGIDTSTTSVLCVWEPAGDKPAVF